MPLRLMLLASISWGQVFGMLCPTLRAACSSFAAGGEGLTQQVSMHFQVARGKAVALRTARPLLATAAAFVLAQDLARALSATSELERSCAIPAGRSAV
jgi:hypothetical protein